MARFNFGDTKVIRLGGDYTCWPFKVVMWVRNCRGREFSKGNVTRLSLPAVHSPRNVSIYDYLNTVESIPGQLHGAAAGSSTMLLGYPVYH